MALKVSASEAAYLVNRHERIVRGRIARGELPATKERNAWRIDVDDLERIPGWRVDRGRLAQLAERDAASVETMAARLAAVERELRDVRARLRTLEARQPTATDSSASAHSPAAGDSAANPGSIGDGGDYNRQPAFPYSATYKYPLMRAPGEAYIGAGSHTFRTHADAARWLVQHGVLSLSTPKSWRDWPPAGAPLEPRPILEDALRRCDPANWRINWRLRQCGDPACVCAELLGDAGASQG